MESVCVVLKDLLFVYREGIVPAIFCVIGRKQNFILSALGRIVTDAKYYFADYMFGRIMF